MSVVQLAYVNAPAPKGSAERGKDPGRRKIQGGAYLIATALAEQLRPKHMEITGRSRD